MSKETTRQETAPPILGTWTRLYAFVLIAHAFIIALFYWFSIVNS